ncbi:MAG: 50S ribosomal protein L21 [Armatimonadetes bacterium]|nr:50S ribosomal protein L21 [Armatimonadota bacterium]
MYAIVKTGGKQYKAEVGGSLVVEKIDAEPSAKVELEEVVLVRGENEVKVGAPFVSGAKVIAEVVKQDRAKKIVGFKYKAKKNQRKRFGHRQSRTWLKVLEIVSK